MVRFGSSEVGAGQLRRQGGAGKLQLRQLQIQLPPVGNRQLVLPQNHRAVGAQLRQPGHHLAHAAQRGGGQVVGAHVGIQPQTGALAQIRQKSLRGGLGRWRGSQLAPGGG